MALAPNNLSELLRTGPAAPLSSAAILAQGRPPLDHAALVGLVGDVGRELRKLGIGRGDRVASVVPDGPEAATAFLAVAANAIAAPLNPALTAAELEFSLGDLTPSAVLVPEGLQHPVRTVAEKLHVRVLDLQAGEPAGMFTLSPADHGGPSPSAGIGDREAKPTDVALMLHTSGTTSRPKQVPLTHANLCASARNVATTLRLSATDRCLCVMPLFHIHGLVATVLASLAAGGSCLCAGGSDPDAFLDLAASQAPTWYSAVPTMHGAILEAAKRMTPVPSLPFRFARSSSAPLPPSLMADLEATLGAPVIEAYGMTEAAHQMASNPLPPQERRPGTVGLAAGPEIAIVGHDGAFLKAGAAGEIVVRGDNVMPGYVEGKGGTDSAFIKGWFRTGDIGTFDEDGYLSIVGRTKEMIDRGGEKVAPREVDDALIEHPAVRQAVAFAVPHPTLGEEVAAAVVLDPDAGATPADLAVFVSERLAPYKVPKQIVVVDQIPKGPTGKLQRLGLADVLGLGGQAAPDQAEITSAVEPTALERSLIALWSSVLGGRPITVHDNFFLAGGDSLSAARLVANVHEALDVAVPVATVFGEAATVAGMSSVIERLRATSRGSSRPSRASGSGRVRASYGQESMWMLGQLDPHGPPPHSLVVLRLAGHLSVDTLRRALDELAARHAVLRTRFHLVNGVLHGSIDDRMRVSLTITEMFEVDDSRVVSAVNEEVSKPFDLEHEQPMRARLFALGTEGWVLVLAIHHIVSDGRTRTILAEDLAALYLAASTSSTAALPDLELGYADFARWEREQMDGAGADELRRFWTELLKDAPASPSLPTHARSSESGARDARRIRVDVPPHVVEQIDELGHAHGATRFMTMIAAFAVLLRRYDSTDDVVIGTDVAGRTLPGADDVAGLFMNALALRFDLSGDPTVTELIERVRALCIDAYAHQEYPIELLLQDLHESQSRDRGPLFDITFDLRPAPQALSFGTELSGRILDVAAALAGRILSIEVHEDAANALSCVLDFDARSLDEATVRRLADHWLRVLEGMATHPDHPISELEMLNDAELGQILRCGRGPERDVPAAPLDALFRRVLERQPDAIAVTDGDISLSYRELSARADAIALTLRGVGIAAGNVVGVAVDRSVELVAIWLAVMKLGGACMPLRGLDPPARLDELLREAGARAVIVERSQDLPTFGGPIVPVADLATAGGEATWSAAAPDDIVYVIFTSGSTGTPKGVRVRHRNFVNFLAGADWVNLGPGEVVALSSDPGFDLAAFELWGPLVHGGTISILPTADVLQPGKLRASLAERGVTVFQLTTALLRQVAKVRPDAFAELDQLLFGGERADPDVIAAIRGAGPPRRMIHWYGPTEITLFATVWEVADLDGQHDEVPIGRPLANTASYVTDVDGHLLPAGMVGELVVAGAGVAAGYTGTPEASSAAFFEHPLLGPAYRTGDLGRLRSDRSLEFVGRKDHQVKIRGFRVEPGEVDARLRHAVKESVTIAVTDGAGTGGLTTYAVLAPGGSVDGLLEMLRSQLPAYMVPRSIEVLDELPLNRRGKVDRAALRLLEPAARPATRAEVITPRNTVEERLAQLWSNLLQVDGGIGARDDFFSLGGHSLLVVRMLAEMEGTVGRSVPLNVFLENPTIEHLAEAVLAEIRVDPDPLLAVLEPRGDRAPLFALMSRNWGSVGFRHFLPALGDDRPLYALGALGISGELPEWGSIEETAGAMIEKMRRLYPSGPYLLCGYSFGGLLAYEISRQLPDQVAMFLVLDTRWRRGLGSKWRAEVAKHELAFLRHRVRQAYGANAPTGGYEALRQSDWIQRVTRRYRPPPTGQKVVLLRCASTVRDTGDPALGWGALVGDNIELRDIPGTHGDMLTRPNVDVVAGIVAEVVRTSEGPS